MSRSTVTQSQSPVVHYLQWKGEISLKESKSGEIIKTNKHHFSYWDKNKGANIDVPIPMTFLVLDILHTIKGFSEADKKGFYANEIRGENFNTDIFKVRMGKNLEAEGLYKDIMPALKARGAKYVQVVYVMMKEAGEYIINCLHIQGAAVSPWVEFCKTTDVNKCAVTVKEWKEQEKGSNRFNEPVFLATSVTPETSKIALEKDAELQKYLEVYFKIKKEPEEEQTNKIEEGEPERPKGEFSSSDDDLPF